MTRVSTPPMVGVLAVGFAMGQAAALPPPVPMPWAGDVSAVVTIEGARRCSAAPAPDGFYTAAHCLTGWRDVAIDGQPVTRWGADPARDLAHVPAASRAVALRRAEPGDVIEVRIVDRPHYRLRVSRWSTMDHSAGSYATDAAAGWQAIVACHEAGRWVFGGDSGAGAWAEDGALVAIVVAAQQPYTPAWPFEHDPDCGLTQRVILVGVP